MKEMKDFDQIARRQGGLKQQLTAGQMSMLAIGGAIGTGLFLGSAYAIQMAGPSVLLSYFIGGVVALLLMGCLAEMTSEHPTPGSFGDYAEFYISPLFGFLVRYSYWSCVVLAVGTEVTAIGMYMQFWFPGTPIWPWALLFSAAMNVIHLPAAAGIFNFIVLVAALSAMNSQLYITTRMMFSLSRAGQAPAALGHVSQRGIPVSALAMSCIGIVVSIVLSLVYPEKSFASMMSISVYGACFTWLMIFVTHLFFRRQHRKTHLKFRMWGFPYTTLAGAGLMAALLISTAFTEFFKMTLWFGIPFTLLLVVVYFLYSRRQPTPIRVETTGAE
ncbi:amino acid permease [Serratia inhibens]